MLSQSDALPLPFAARLTSSSSKFQPLFLLLSNASFHHKSSLFGRVSTCVQKSFKSLPTHYDDQSLRVLLELTSFSTQWMIAQASYDQLHTIWNGNFESCRSNLASMGAIDAFLAFLKRWFQKVHIRENVFKLLLEAHSEGLLKNGHIEDIFDIIKDHGLQKPFALEMLQHAQQFSSHSDYFASLVMRDMTIIIDAIRIVDRHTVDKSRILIGLDLLSFHAGYIPHPCSETFLSIFLAGLSSQTSEVLTRVWIDSVLVLMHHDHTQQLLEKGLLVHLYEISLQNHIDINLVKKVLRELMKHDLIASMDLKELSRIDITTALAKQLPKHAKKIDPQPPKRNRPRSAASKLKTPSISRKDVPPISSTPAPSASKPYTETVPSLKKQTPRPRQATRPKPVEKPLPNTPEKEKKVAEAKAEPQTPQKKLVISEKRKVVVPVVKTVSNDMLVQETEDVLDDDSFSQAVPRQLMGFRDRIYSALLKLSSDDLYERADASMFLKQAVVYKEMNEELCRDICQKLFDCFYDEDQIIIYSCETIYNLALTPAYIEIIFQSGLIDLLKDTLKSYQLGVIEAALKALVLLVEKEKYAKLLATSATLKDLYTVLFSSIESIRKSAKAIIQHLILQGGEDIRAEAEHLMKKNPWNSIYQTWKNDT